MFDDAQFRLKHLTAHKSKNGKARCPVDRASLGVVELRPVWFRKSPGVYAISATAIIRPRRDLKLVEMPVDIGHPSLEG
jgi:hypothetical protein